MVLITMRVCHLLDIVQGGNNVLDLADNKSEWLTISKGATQGSIFGPLVFNLFQND